MKRSGKGIFKKALLACLAVVFCLMSASACGGTNADLVITAIQLGYGTEWLEAMAEAYEAEHDIDIEIRTRIGIGSQTQLDDQINSLAGDTDLYFGKRGWFAEWVYKGSIFSHGQTYPCLFANLDDVWGDVVDEGTTLTIADKMDPTYAEAFQIEGHYYSIPWAGGVYGIVRNVSVWEDLGLTDADVPLTTNQLFDLCDEIKGDVAPFIYSLKEEYYTSWLPIFFGQYEGVQNVKNFMNGIDPEGNVSQYIYTYDGQLEALRVMQTLLDPDNRYQHPASSGLDFTSMQGQFLSGEALFCINGSWLENEAKANFSDSRTDVIKTPVISSLVNRLSFHDQLGSADAEEAKLIELIQYVDAVDAGQTPEQPAGVTEDDIRKVTEARHYAYMAGGIDHQAYIASYSAHVEEAKDFLRFMYSDEGMTIYYQTLSGATLPATPVTAYPEIEMSEFRVSVNQATEEGFVYDREPKARYFVLGKISACFENDVDPIVALLGGISPEEIIRLNNAEVNNKWNDIQELLGLI